jgi:ribosome biogenesis protein MAK21
MCEVFFDILYFSVKNDEDVNRAKAFLKRLFQIALNSSSNFIVTCLMFLAKIFKAKPGLETIITHNQNFYTEDEEEHF